MNYIGSKKSLLDFVYKNIINIIGSKSFIFSDLFAGTGIVGRYFKEKGHRVIANDLQYYSFVLNRNYIGNHTELGFYGLQNIIPELFVGNLSNYKDIVIDYLNNLPPKKGFIYNNYSLGGTRGKEFERLYFSDENALKCDAIRQKIESWKKDKLINSDEYFFLLASLLESIDKVANTASVYGAFLKELKKSAQKTMVVKPADFFVSDKLYKEEHSVFNKDINEMILESSHDVVYLDPPYNERQYSANYHLLETIALYDEPDIRGKTGLRDYSKQKSNYCKKSDVLKSFDDLVQKIDAKYIFLSYNDEGLMSLEEIKEIMSKRGNYGVLTKEYRRFKADKTENRNHKKDSVIEYLHYVEIV